VRNRYADRDVEAPDDDEILEAYELELAAEPVPIRRSNRGFWVVIVTIGLACVILVGEIFANKPLGDQIGHAQHSLTLAQGAAQQIRTTSGSFAAADPAGLATIQPGLRFLGPDAPSAGLDEVSVAASDTGWAAAVQARPGACFYLRLTDDASTFYGAGETCSGRAALSANQLSW
jgi:hypothetical protein